MLSGCASGIPCWLMVTFIEESMVSSCLTKRTKSRLHPAFWEKCPRSSVLAGLSENHLNAPISRLISFSPFSISIMALVLELVVPVESPFSRNTSFRLLNPRTPLVLMAQYDSCILNLLRIF